MQCKWQDTYVLLSMSPDKKIKESVETDKKIKESVEIAMIYKP